MKVTICKQCQHYRRRTWTQSYKPANYHEIGFTHAYGYCALHKERCLKIRKCNKEDVNDT